MLILPIDGIWIIGCYGGLSYSSGFLTLGYSFWAYQCLGCFAHAIFRIHSVARFKQRIFQVLIVESISFKLVVSIFLFMKSKKGVCGKLRALYVNSVVFVLRLQV